MQKLYFPPVIPEKFKKNGFEQDAWGQGRVVCGIDEVGRGCLAGPLVTAAVILPPHKTHRLLKDSKILTEQERLKAYSWIIKNCHYGIGIVHNRLIDQHNVWRATLIAMKKALVHLLAVYQQHPVAILIDAMPLNTADTSFKEIPVYYFNKGENKSSSIAAASIVAKVKRDAMMRRFDSLVPGYELVSHKGYSTPKHKNILLMRKASIIHRKSFLKTITIMGEGSYEQQQTIC
jgi:ribonuclease HII